MRRLNNLDGTRRKGHAARHSDRKAVLRRWTAIVEWRHLADWPLSRCASGCNGSRALGRRDGKQPLRYAGPANVRSCAHSGHDGSKDQSRLWPISRHSESVHGGRLSSVDRTPNMATLLPCECLLKVESTRWVLVPQSRGSHPAKIVLLPSVLFPA